MAGFLFLAYRLIKFRRLSGYIELGAAAGVDYISRQSYQWL
jgi:hypothetical protein